MPGTPIRWAPAVLAVVAALLTATFVAAGAPQRADARLAGVERALLAGTPTDDIESGDDHLHTDEPEPVSPPVALTAGRNRIRPDSPWAGRWGSDIEPLAAYEPQRLCMPGPRPAVLRFATLLQGAYADGRYLGITRACDAGSRSEHKEGRAYDWGLDVTVPAERAAGDRMLAWLLATDEHGNDFAMARRLGVMYVIWDGHIWSSTAADEGWRVYTGPSPHTDHVHISFDWAGALGLTSFWDATGLGLDGGLLTSPFLAELPSRFHLGGETYRSELGPAPGSTTGWSDDDAGRDRQPETSDAPDPGDPEPSTVDDDDDEAPSDATTPGTPSMVPPTTVPLPILDVPLIGPVIDTTSTSTTTTTLTVPLVDDLVDELDAGPVPPSGWSRSAVLPAG